MARFVRSLMALAAGTISMVAASMTAQAQPPLGTAFTYQGRLTQGGAPANGPHNFVFTLFDAAAAGSTIGTPVTINGHPVNGGVFAVSLDFGASAFNGEARWLQVAVNGTTLTPRQPLNAVPYAVQTRGIYVNDSGSVGIGTTTPFARLDVARDWDGEHGAVNILGNMPAVRFTGGAASDNRSWMLHLGANGTLGFHIRDLLTGFQPTLVMQTNNRVGIGTLFPAQALHVLAPDCRLRLQSGPPSAHAAVEYQTNAYTWHTGVGGSQTGPLSNQYYIFDANAAQVRLSIGSNGTTINGTNNSVYALDVTTTFNHAVRGSTFGGVGIEGISHFGFNGIGVKGVNTSPNGTNTGVYGQSDSPSGWDFFAGGAGTNYGSSSSIRWKRHIEPMADPLGMLEALRGVYFNWDESHGGHRDIGMIAEEVGEVLPEVVQYEANGIDAIGMDYSKLTPLLAEAIKALRQEKDVEIAALQAQAAAQQAEMDSEIAALRGEVDQLNQLVRELASQLSKGATQ